MKSKLKKSITGGLFATAIMTIFMFIISFIGMPKMNPAVMLADTMDVPIFVGWINHFIIGIIFSLLFIFLFHPLVKIRNRIIKGSVFGLLVFILAQVGMVLMSLIFGEIQGPDGNPVLMMIGSISSHIVYGIAIALIIIGRYE